MSLVKSGQFLDATPVRHLFLNQGLFEYIFWIRNAGCRARLRGLESKIYLYRMRWYAMQ